MLCGFGVALEMDYGLWLELADVVVAGSGGAKDVVDHVSFRVRSGEIVGVAGVEGSGQFELCEAIMGIRPLASGAIRLGGRDITEPRAGLAVRLALMLGRSGSL